MRYVVRGTTGTYTKFGVDPQENQLKVIKSPSDIHTSAEYGQEPEELFGILENQRGDDVVRTMCVSDSIDSFRPCSCASCSWPSKAKGDYAGLFRDVAKTIREGTPQAVKWEESAEVLEIIELAYQSSKEGRTIEVPPRS